MSGFLSARATRWSLVGLALVVFGVTNLPWHLDDYDQAKQAFTSFEMVESGHWFYQHTPNWWVATKPPLVGWISAAFYGLTGSWEIAWRLPSFLAAVGVILLLVRATETYGRVASLVALCAFSFNLFTPRLVTLVRTDMPLGLVLFAIGVLILEKIRAPAPWTLRERIILFLLLSVGMLIKGPIVYAFLLPGILAMAWRSRRTGKPNPAWSGWLPWLLSFLVFVVWVSGGILLVREFTQHVVLREFAGRFSGEVHRAQPFYYYLPHLIHRFAPWSLLGIAIAFLAFSRKHDASADSRSSRRMISPEMFWLVAWSAGGLLVLSCIPSKRIDRIFPIIPPLCLLLAAGVAETRMRFPKAIDRLAVIAIGLAAIGITGYTTEKVILAFQENRAAFAVFGRAVVREAAAHHWRYAVVGGDDEGLLLYARRMEFLDSSQAVVAWNDGKLDALVVPDDELAELLPQLRGPEPKQVLISGATGRYGRRYVLLGTDRSG